jgi:hypothetical protein
MLCELSSAAIPVSVQRDRLSMVTRSLETGCIQGLARIFCHLDTRVNTSPLHQNFVLQLIAKFQQYLLKVAATR